MKDRIIANILRKMGIILDPKQKMQLEITLCKELEGVKIIRESTEMIRYNDSIKKLKNIYLATLAVENKSLHTIEQYNLHLTQFADYFKGKDLHCIDATDIRAFLFSYRQNRQISDVSLNNKRGAISSFFTWLINEEYIQKDPTRKIKRINVVKSRKKAYTANELEKMRMECKDIRDRAILEMLDCTGCRVSELCSINIADINFATKEIKIIGKGRKERTVFIADRAIPYLDLYLANRKDDNPALFVSKRKINGDHIRLKKDGVERIVRELGRKCGIHAHPHKFRRTYCTNLINRGMPAQDVAILMGHSDVNMTCNIYYDANLDRLRYQYEKYAA